MVLAKTLQNPGHAHKNQGSAFKNIACFVEKTLKKNNAFLDFDFEGILDGFWEGFERPNNLIFALFSTFFRCKIWNEIWKGQKLKKRVQKVK